VDGLGVESGNVRFSRMRFHGGWRWDCGWVGSCFMFSTMEN
jgi:hypothetical protein